MHGFIDCVICIAARAVDVGNGMAGGAGYTSLGRRMVHIIEFRIVKSSTEERHNIVATRTPARCFYVAVSLKRHLRVSRTLNKYGWLLKELK